MRHCEDVLHVGNICTDVGLREQNPTRGNVAQLHCDVKSCKTTESFSDEYACIPNPYTTLVHLGKGTKYIPKINTTSAEQLHRAMLPLPLAIKDLATASLLEYVATHSPKTDYLVPLRTRH